MDAGDVLKVVEGKMRQSLTKEDLEELPTGGQRWHKNANFARLNLVKSDFLASHSPRGVWELTSKARAHSPREGSET